MLDMLEVLDVELVLESLEVELVLDVPGVELVLDILDVELVGESSGTAEVLESDAVELAPVSLGDVELASEPSDDELALASLDVELELGSSPPFWLSTSPPERSRPWGRGLLAGACAAMGNACPANRGDTSPSGRPTGRSALAHQQESLARSVD